MESITKSALTNSRFTILAILTGIFLGIWFLITMPRQEDPTITIRVAQVNAYFPGMPTNLMEDLIAKPLERKLREIPEVEDINTTITQGHVLLQPKLHDRYFDLDPIWQDMRNKMEEAQNSLPQGTQGPFVNDDFGRVAVATVAITGRGFTMRELHNEALDLQDKLSTISGISKIELYGNQDERIYLHFDIASLGNYGIAPEQVTAALSAQNIILSGGTIEVNGRNVQIEPSGRFLDLEEIRNVRITTPETGLPVYLRDIAKVTRSYVYPANKPAYFNNKPAIVLSFSMVAQFNIDKFGEILTQRLDELKQDLPLGLDIEYATYQPKLVKKSVGSAVSNLMQTIAVVLLVVMTFLGIRNGLIVGTIVPLTIMFTLIFMDLLAIDLQNMSIAAIIIALGLLVDNAIVVAEDIEIRTKSGVNIREASILTVKSLAIPILTSSLTTMLAFMPLALSENATGEYLSSLSYVLVIALGTSWFLSITITPAMCCWFTKKERHNSQKNVSFTDILIYKIQLYYKSALNTLIKHPYSFLATMVILFFISVYMLKFIPRQMLPYSDRNQYLVYVDLPAGSSSEHTKEVTRRLTSWLENKEINPEIESNIAYIGFGGPRFVLSLSPPNAKDNVAFVIVNTKSAKEIEKLIVRTSEFANNEMPEASVKVKQMWMGGQEIGLLEYRISGPDTETLYKLAGKLEKTFHAKEGAIGISNDWQNPVVTLQVNIDQNRAQRANVSSKSVANSLSSYFDGYTVTDFQDGEYSIPIVLRGTESRNRLSELRTLPVFTNDGKIVPLIQIANIRSKPNLSTIKRYNQERTITISLKHAYLQAQDFHKLILPEIQKLKLPEHYRLEFGGELESSKKANKSLFANFPYALIGMALLIITQFNSFRRTLIIMLTIPLVAIGAVAGLWLGNAFFSFTAILGMLSLAGIVINNGIILIDKADIECGKGLDVKTAIMNAAETRLRPILMTTLTTILGLIPMALFGGAMWYPMAIVIMAGLFTGTVLTLGFVPILYIMLNPHATYNKSLSE